MNTFDNHRVRYLELVVPKEAGPIQVLETKRAFYSGAISIVNIIDTMCEKDASVSELGGLFEAVIKEAEAFYGK
jgi:hypothetical protein